MKTLLTTTLLLGLGAALAVPPHAAAAAPREARLAPVLYVSPTGDNSAAGTPAEPLRTPQVAVDRVPDGGTVYLLPGTYHRQRILLEHRHDVTVAATRTRRAVLNATGLTPRLDDSGVVEIRDSTGVTVRGLDIRKPSPSSPFSAATD